MNREKHFHPLAALHLLRKTLLVYLLPLVQVLFARNWDALRAALRQDLVLLFFISAVCWAVYYGGRWQVDAEGTVHVSWRLGVRLDRALRAEGLAALVLEQPLVYRLTGACRVVLYPVGQTKTITLYLTRQQAEELAEQIEAIDGVSEAAFDNTEDHYKNSSAMFSVTFDGEEDDQISIDAMDEIRAMLADYDLAISSTVGSDSSAQLAKELQTVTAVAAGIIMYRICHESPEKTPLPKR